MATDIDRFAPFTPSDEDKALAAESIRCLGRHVQKPRKLTLRVKGQKGPDAELVLPAGAVQLLETILTEIARGNSVATVPVQAELTSQQAADLLNVSWPYLIKLLDQGKIRHHKSGLHRRVALKDVLDYKRSVDQRREAVLAELAASCKDSIRMTKAWHGIWQNSPGLVGLLRRGRATDRLTSASSVEPKPGLEQREARELVGVPALAGPIVNEHGFPDRLKPRLQQSKQQPPGRGWLVVNAESRRAGIFDADWCDVLRAFASDATRVALFRRLRI